VAAAASGDSEIRHTENIPVTRHLRHAGHIRLWQRTDEARFGYAVGRHSRKQSLLPPAVRQWTLLRAGAAQSIAAEPVPAARFAVIGVRACKLAAIAIQDRPWCSGAFVDDDYAARRAQVLIVAARCTQTGDTCFCASMRSGPRTESEFDLAPTELLPGSHRFVVEAGNSHGAALPAALGLWEATGADHDTADAASTGAAAQVGRTLDTTGLPALLQRSYLHPYRDDVAARARRAARGAGRRGRGAARRSHAGSVRLRSYSGTVHAPDLPSGAQLPRIC
jgi:hypothetical protein